MYYVSIDVGKFNHCCSVIETDGEVLVEPFFFSNNKSGFELFSIKTKEFVNEKHIAGLESTGHYGDNLISFLLENNYFVGVINPLSTDAQRKSRIRKTKNDKVDTLIIYKVLQNKEYTVMSKEKFGMIQTKQLTRLRANLKKDSIIAKIRLQGAIDIVFPEYNGFFRSKYSKVYMNVLKEFGGASVIANTNLSTLKKAINLKGRGIKTDYDVNALKELAKNSIGASNDIIVFKIKQLINTIELLELQIKDVDKKIEELAKELNSPIFTIPGVGTTTGMSILSEIGDISLFSNASKLIAFAGVDPATYQSGEFNAPVTAISKRGSTYLRYSLYQCILSVCTHNPIFNQYYSIKKEQGKGHRCAQSHCVRKLLRIIYVMLTNNVRFDETKLK